jgi:3-oxoadipate enol-lactonase
MKKLKIRGAELAHEDCGSGPLVVLVHGFPFDHSMWNAQIEALAADHRVIAPDLRGFGQSEPFGETVGMEQFADDLAALLDVISISKPIVLCGLSMGGYIAFQFWRKYADRLRGLILCDTRAICDTPEMAAGRREMAERVLREGPAPLVDGMIPKLFAPSTLEHRPEVVASLRKIMMSHHPTGIAAALRGMAERPDSNPLLPEIRCPTLVIAGQFDAISTPDEMRGIAAAIPKTRFVEIAGCGHMAPLECPAKVNAAMKDFLASLG